MVVANNKARRTMTATETENDKVRQTVRSHYGKVASTGGGCGCAPTCCSADSTNHQTDTNPRTGASVTQKSFALGYTSEDVAAAPDGANLGLGCGNPLAIASLKAGQTVLDLGSGGGFDVFLAAKAVGPGGLVIGVDMTPEMVSKARAAKAKGGFTNVDFRLGEIEHLPVADDSVDVIISNCVVNLSPDKGAVFREAYRVLKPGGRMAISDIHATAPMPEHIRQDLELLAGCVAGASTEQEIRKSLQSAGFKRIQIIRHAESQDFIRECFPGRGVDDYIVSGTIEAVK